mgnify:CR=1 FL=1
MNDLKAFAHKSIGWYKKELRDKPLSPAARELSLRESLAVYPLFE